MNHEKALVSARMLPGQEVRAVENVFRRSLPGPVPVRGVGRGSVSTDLQDRVRCHVIRTPVQVTKERILWRPLRGDASELLQVPFVAVGLASAFRDFPTQVNAESRQMQRIIVSLDACFEGL